MSAGAESHHALIKRAPVRRKAGRVLVCLWGGTGCARGGWGARGEKGSNGTHTRAPHRVPRRSIWPEYRPRSSTAAKGRRCLRALGVGMEPIVTRRMESRLIGPVASHRARARAGIPRGARDCLSYGDLMCGLPDIRWERERAGNESQVSANSGPLLDRVMCGREPDSISPTRRSDHACPRAIRLAPSVIRDGGLVHALLQSLALAPTGSPAVHTSSHHS